MKFLFKLLAGLRAWGEAALSSPTTPLELLRRAFFSGPAMVDARSTGPTAFAGRTTLNSGTAFVTISTQQVNSDSLILHSLQVNTTCGSGTNYALAVSSIVSGVSFALGYFDGQGRAPGGTIMWELRKTS